MRYNKKTISWRLSVPDREISRSEKSKIHPPHLFGNMEIRG